MPPITAYHSEPLVIPLLKSSLFELLWNTVDGKLKNTKVKTSSKTAVAVVLASEGYPNKYDIGMKIKGLENVDNKLIFHAGTRKVGHDLLVTGGRVLNVVGFGEDLFSAINDAYEIVKLIEFNGKYCRKDIGMRGLNLNRRGE